MVTVVIRGWLLVSYPIGGLSTDDNQAGQRYLIDEILRGNMFIGNLRYHTGYALVMSPVAAITSRFGRLDDRLLLLVQVGLSTLVPFMVYDIVRRRWTKQAAFIVALFIALDPFVLEWAHFVLPEWLVSFCVVLALWLLQRAWHTPKRRLVWTALAGSVLGIACLARWNSAPVAAAAALTLFVWRHIAWRERAAMFICLGVCMAAVPAFYLALIHRPSTGVWTLNCNRGTNLVASLAAMGVPMAAANGVATRHYLEIVTLPPLKPVTFLADSYPLWRKPGGWVTREERETFLAQGRPSPASSVSIAFPGNLYYYLGPCEVDRLLARVHAEAVAAHPGNLD